MPLQQKVNRLSVMPDEAVSWKFVLEMEKLKLRLNGLYPLPNYWDNMTGKEISLRVGKFKQRQYIQHLYFNRGGLSLQVGQ